ncbi:MAG: rod shape-determining protein [bacterium]|nr:rod shape-determining protein [bacterium]
MSKIAFDIGSTVTRVSVGDKIIFQQPTCLAIDRSSGETVAIGTQAYSLLGKTAKQLEIQFPVTEGIVADTQSLTTYLTGVLQACRAEVSSTLKARLLGHQAAVAYHACSTTAQQVRLQRVFQQIGLRARFVLCPEAISAHLIKKRPAQSLCMIDIGGTTTVCSVVTNGSHLQSYKIPWGGIRLTEGIQRWLAKEEQFAVGWHEAERLKQALAAVFTEKTLAKYRTHKAVVRGQDLSTHVGKSLVVSREQLSFVVQTQAEEFVLGVTQFLTQLPREMVSALLADGVTFVGGGSLLPGLAEFLQEKLACEVSCAPNPDLTCIRGLA